MKKKILFYTFLLLLSVSMGFRGYSQNNNYNNSTSFESLDLNSTLVEVPQILKEFENDREISDTVLTLIFEDNYDSEYQYFYQYKIIDTVGIYFIITKIVDPGIMGIYNIILYQIIFNKNKELIDTKEIGCFCNDYNLGINQTISSEPVLYIDYGQIKVITTTKDEILYWDSDSSSLTITSDTTIYFINKKGW